MRLAFGLISLLVTVTIIAFLATHELSSLNSTGNPKQPVNSALSLKNQTDLVALETKLNDYFIRNNSYPQDLTTVNADTSEFSYTLCQSDEALVTQTGSNTSVILKGGSVTSNNSC